MHTRNILRIKIIFPAALPSPGFYPEISGFFEEVGIFFLILKVNLGIFGERKFEKIDKYGKKLTNKQFC